MIILAMVGYYVFAIGLLAWIAYSVGRRNNEKMRRAADEAIAHMHALAARTPPLEPYVREPIPDDDEEDAEPVGVASDGSSPPAVTGK